MLETQELGRYLRVMMRLNALGMVCVFLAWGCGLLHIAPALGMVAAVVVALLSAMQGSASNEPRVSRALRLVAVGAVLAVLGGGLAIWLLGSEWAQDGPLDFHGGLVATVLVSLTCLAGAWFMAVRLSKRPG